MPKCQYPKCGRFFVKSKYHTRKDIGYCSEAHGHRHRDLLRISDIAAAHKKPGVRIVRKLREEVPAGLCIYCERRLTGTQRMKCLRVECNRAYQADYKRACRTWTVEL